MPGCDPRLTPNLHSNYSDPAAERAGLERFVVRDLRVHRGYEGPQVIVSWRAPEMPAEVLEVRLVRRLHDYPAGPEDGKVLYAGPPGDGRLADLDLLECRCTYYAVFSLRRDTEEWVSLPRARAEIIPLKSGFFPGKLMALLPEVYLIADKKLEKGGAGRVALERRTDAATREVFNLHEDGVTKKGQLARFLKIFGTELDVAKGLIDCLPHLLDVDETCGHYLPFIAALVGLELNRELPIPQQREEIKREVEVYKLKGTIFGIAAKARSITGFPVEVDEWCDNLLVANRLDRTSADFRPEVKERLGLPRDPTAYVIDGSAGADYACGRFGVYFEIPCGECLARSVVEKLARVLPRYTPACAKAKPIFLDCRYLETYDRGRLGEFHRSEVLERPRVETLYDLCWLIANDPLRLTNSRFGTAAPGVACRDAWYDRIEVLDRVYTDDARTLRWLYANDRHRRSNSHFRTATPVDYAMDAWNDRTERRADIERVDARARWLLANWADRLSNRLHLAAFPWPAADLWHDLGTEVPEGAAIAADGLVVSLDVEARVPALRWLLANEPTRRSNSRYVSAGPLSLVEERWGDV